MSRGQIFWLAFVNFTQTRLYWQEGNTIEELPLSDQISHDMLVEHFVNDKYEQAEPTVGSVTP